MEAFKEIFIVNFLVELNKCFGSLSEGWGSENPTIITKNLCFLPHIQDLSSVWMPAASSAAYTDRLFIFPFSSINKWWLLCFPLFKYSSAALLVSLAKQPRRSANQTTQTHTHTSCGALAIQSSVLRQPHTRSYTFITHTNTTAFRSVKPSFCCLLKEEPAEKSEFPRSLINLFMWELVSVVFDKSHRFVRENRRCLWFVVCSD